MRAWMRKQIIKLIQKYILSTDTEVRPGDLMHKGDNDAAYEALGVYYNQELKPFMFFRDDNGAIFSCPGFEARKYKGAIKYV